MQTTLAIDQNVSANAVAKRKILVYWREYEDKRNSKDELLVFGPNYMAKDDAFWRKGKKDYLGHVLGNPCSDGQLKNAVKSIERDAREAYRDDALNNMTEDFLDVMAEDGCFFLLLAFSILGAGPKLNFPVEHLVFGEGRDAEHKTRWLEAIFLVGNQVPFEVLKKLMELPFFQELIKEEKQWYQPSEELAKRTLHKFLMGGQGPREGDLIHCLQSIVLGTETASVEGITEIPRDRQGIPSAQQLSQRGVQFKTLEGELGIRSIHYQHSNFNSVLYLPVLKVDEHTELLVECLRKYETVQCRRPWTEHEASSYFELLRDLISTTDDLEFLSSRGIIQGDRRSLQRLLSNIQFSGTSRTSAHLSRIRQLINKERPLPWRNSIKLMLKVIWTVSACLTLILTYLQAHYTILAYYRNVH